MLQLGLAGGRPVKTVLADAQAGRKLSANEWKLLGFYSWETDEQQLVPAAHASDGKGYEVQVGDRALVDVLPDVPELPSLVWPRRIAALLLGLFGALLLLPERPRTHHDVLLAAGVGALLVGALACVMWLGTDMAVGAAWFAVALAGLGLAVWRIRATAS